MKFREACKMNFGKREALQFTNFTL